MRGGGKYRVIQSVFIFFMEPEMWISTLRMICRVRPGNRHGLAGIAGRMSEKAREVRMPRTPIASAANVHESEQYAGGR
jgi:hypothetical protein